MPETICPLFMLALKVAQRPANSGAAQCIGDKCAWWDDVQERCGMVSQAVIASIELERREMRED